MSFHTVYLLKDGSVHVREYRDRDHKNWLLDYELIASATNVAAITQFDSAHDIRHAQVLATNEWLDNGTLDKEGLL